MASRFKVSGTDYVSEWGGNSLNVGTNPETPYAGLADINVSLTGRTVVIGTGVYKGNNYPNQIRTYRGDGRVVLDGLNGSFNSNQNSTFIKLILRNFSSLFMNNSSASDCVFRNIGGFSTFSSTQFNLGRCVYLESDFTPSYTAFASLQSCLIFNSMSTALSVNNGVINWSGSYFAKNTFLIVRTNEAFGTSNFDNACINGKISRNGILYEAKLLYDGTARPDADAGTLDIITVFPNFYSRGNFACVDPEILDLENKLVAPTSPLLKRSHAGGYIGAVRPARYVPLADPDFEVTFSQMDTTNPDSVVVAAGQTDGTVRMTGKVSDSLISSSLFAIRSIMQYWKGAAAGTTENNNVPDAVKTLGLAAGDIDKPRRLTYLMRTSTDATANQASSDAIWDNNGAIAGDYLLFEANTVPAHIGGVFGTLGNGDPRAVGGTETPFNFKAVDIIFMLDNDRD